MLKVKFRGSFLPGHLNTIKLFRVHLFSALVTSRQSLNTNIIQYRHRWIFANSVKTHQHVHRKQQALNSWLRPKAGHADEVDEENEHFVSGIEIGRVGNAGDAGACMSMVHFDKFS